MKQEVSPEKSSPGTFVFPDKREWGRQQWLVSRVLLSLYINCFFSPSPLPCRSLRNHPHPENLQILFSVTDVDLSGRLIRGQGNFVLVQMRSPHFSDRIGRRDEYHLSSRLAEMAAWKVRRKALCDSGVLRIVRIACARGDRGVEKCRE